MPHEDAVPATAGQGLLVDTMPTDSLPQLTPIAYSEGGMEFEGYTAAPSGEGPFPCIVLGHDWSGPNRSTQTIARRLTAFGYAVFLIDAYGKGLRGDELGDNSNLMGPMMADRALLGRRVRAGYEAARAQPGIDGNRMAALGFCFGGLCILDLARSNPDGLCTAISVHGALGAPQGNPQATIRSRILILHGWEDPVAPPDDVVALATELTRAGAPWELQAYGHALHAFTFADAAMPEKGIQFHPDSARRAETAILRELKSMLT